MESASTNPRPEPKRKRLRASKRPASGQHHGRQLASSSSPAAEGLLWLVDLAIMGLVFVAPYFMGGRYPVGQFVFVLLMVVAAGAWFARQCLLPSAKWTRSSADWLIPLALFVVGIQLIPLPSAWLESLSPSLTKNLPLWTTDLGAQALGARDAIGWHSISVTPNSTAGGLTLLAAYGLLLWVVVQRYQRLPDIDRLLRWIAASAVLMAFFGLAQFFFSNEKFLWIYEHPFRTTNYRVKGAFINQSHFAHMLALGIGPLLYWLVRSVQRLEENSQHAILGSRYREVAVRKTLLLGAGLLVLMLAVGLSISRGGVLCVAIAVLVAFGMMCWKGVVPLRFFLGFVASTSVLLGVSLAIYGYVDVVDRLSDLTSGSVEQLDNHRGRRKIWEANWQAFQDSPLAGTGVGSHREVYPKYLVNPPVTEYTHAESGYFQVSTETGTLGMSVLFLAIGTLGWKGLQTFRRASSRRVQTALAAVIAGLVASLTHSSVDFVWYIPACMTLTILLMGSLLSLRNLVEKKETPKTWPLPRAVWGAATIMVLGCGLIMIQNRTGPALASSHWDAYLHASRKAKKDIQKQLLENVETLAVLYSPDQTQRETEMMGHLEKVLEKEPNHARAHMRLAAHTLRRFEQFQQISKNPMPLTQIRDAVIASDFDSQEAMESWLTRALGKHWVLLKKARWHTRRSLALSPYQGEGYVYLARLCFLDQQGAKEKSALLDQAVALRPYDGEVLYRVGNEALLAGDSQSAIAFWKRSYHSSLIDQDRILRVMQSQIRMAELVTLFEPKLTDLPRIYQLYKKIRTKQSSQNLLASQEAQTLFNQDVVNLLAYHQQLAEANRSNLSPSSMAKSWIFAGRLYQDLNQPKEEVACLRRALTLETQVFASHRSLAEALIRAGEFEEAKKEIHWCSRRHPQMKLLARLMKKAEMGWGSKTHGTANAKSATWKK